MKSVIDKPAYRILRSRRTGDFPKKYQATYELMDERTQATVAACDLIGRAVFDTLEIREAGAKRWTMKPNRRIMPSRWLVTDAGGRLAVQFDQKLLGKLTNPLYKTVLAILDGNGDELCRLIDLHNAKAARVLGLESGKYAISRNDKVLAHFQSLPRKEQPRSKGLLGRLTGWLTAADPAIVSLGTDHALPAPFALAMYLLHDELTDTSAG